MNKPIGGMAAAGIILAGVLGVIILSDTAMATDTNYDRYSPNHNNTDGDYDGYAMHDDCHKWKEYDYTMHNAEKDNCNYMHDKHYDKYYDKHYDKYYDKHYDKYYDKHYGKITVFGTASTVVNPELLHIRIGVETHDPVVSDALNDNSRLLTDITDALMQMGLNKSDIATTHFNIYPEYEYRWDENTNENKRIFTGYKVSNFIEVSTTQLDLGAQIIDSAVTAGATNIDDVKYLPSPDQETQIRDSLLQDAVLDAKRQADIALKPLNQKIIGVQEVVLVNGIGNLLDETIGAFTGGEFARAQLDSSTPLFTPDSSISVSVTVVFHIGPQ